jgi:hypothetical protein
MFALNWLTGFRGIFFKHFPHRVLCSNYVRWRWPSWMEVGVTGHNFESWPPKDHSCHVCFKLTYWFQRRLLIFFSIGSYVKIKSRHGGHLEFPIGKRFTSLVQDHPMIIPAKSQFNWLGGFWQEDF